MKNALLSFPVEIRSEKNADGKRKIVGRAAVFEKLSEDLGGFRERILPGAFTKTLSEGSVKKAYWNHNSDRVLGSTKAGTLILEERKDGLYFEIDPPSWAEEHIETIDRGDVDQMSFGFRTIKDRWLKTEQGEVTRELVEVRLFEVSPVAMPAYPQTDAQVRTAETGRLQALLVQADHDLLDDTGRAELRDLISAIQQQVDTHHIVEPSDHSITPEGSPDTNIAETNKLKDRLRLLSVTIGD